MRPRWGRTGRQRLAVGLGCVLLAAACGSGNAGTAGPAGGTPAPSASSGSPAGSPGSASAPFQSPPSSPPSSPVTDPSAGPSGNPPATASRASSGARSGPPSGPARSTPARWNEPDAFPVAPVRIGSALRGRVVLLDPGHQLGNSRHPEQVNTLVNAGAGVRKPCNTTGTETDGGYPESRVAMRIALAAKRRLEAQGARVVLTRPREDATLWGPCIDARGRAGKAAGADAVVSIHADGAPAGARGFHVIRPASVQGWTDDVAAPSRRLATAVHGALVAAGQRPADYIGSRDGYDVRSDLGTLNWSDRPICMVELGNMRSRPDAEMLTDPRWQDGVAAAAITAGVVDFLS